MVIYNVDMTARKVNWCMYQKQSFTSTCNHQSYIQIHTLINFSSSLLDSPCQSAIPAITASLLVFLPQPAARLDQCSQGIPGVLRLQWIYLGCWGSKIKSATSRQGKRWGRSSRWLKFPSTTWNVEGKHQTS